MSQTAPNSVVNKATAKKIVKYKAEKSLL